VGFLPHDSSLAIHCNSKAHSPLRKHRLVALPRKELQPPDPSQDPKKHKTLHQWGGRSPGPTCQNLATATALRLREAAAWTTGSTGHSSILTKHTSLPYSTGYVPPIVIPTGTDWDNLPHQFENAVNIYTDGSKPNTQTGGGVFSPET